MKKILETKYLFFIFLSVVLMELILVAHFFQIIPTSKFLSSIMPEVLIDLTNRNREQIKMHYLEQNSLLAKAAQLKAEDMVSKEYFAHTSPEGTDPWHWFDIVGYDYIYAGENLAVNFFDSYEIDKAWMNSPKHMKNIINNNFNEIGIGMATGNYKGRESIFVVQLFGTQKKPTVVLNEPIEITQEIQEPLLEEETIDVLGEEVEIPQEKEREDVEYIEEEKEEEKEKEKENEEESFVFVSKEEVLPYDSGRILNENKKVLGYSSLIGRVASSPKRTFSLILVSMLFVLAFLLILKIFFKSKLRFPILVADGLLVLIAIFSALLFNSYTLSLMSQIY